MTIRSMTGAGARPALLSATLLLLTTALVDAQTLTNTGTINQQVNLSNYLGQSFDALDNSGTISTNSGEAVIRFAPISSITNRASGTIESTSNAAIYSQVVLIDNFGTITGRGFGINSTDLGELNNFGTIAGTGANSTGLFIGSLGTLRNSGTITGVSTAVEIYGFSPIDEFVNEAAGLIESTDNYAVKARPVTTFVNRGTIRGRGGIIWSGVQGSFTNTGTITAGDYDGLNFQSGVDTFTNSGTITSTTGNAVRIQGAPTSFINTGTITAGGSAVAITGKVGTFTNDGTITSEGNDGLQLQYGVNTFVNRGSIASNATSSRFGVIVQGPSQSFENFGTITGATGLQFATAVASAVNYGTITGTAGEGVYLQGYGSSFTNKSGATVRAQGGFGVYASSPLAGFINEAGALIDGGLYLQLDGDAVNSGTITGDDPNGAVFISSSTSGSTFTNTGLIRGVGTHGVSINSWDFAFINSGRIEAGAGKLSVLVSSPYSTLKVLPGSELVGKIGTYGNSTFDASEYTGTTVFDPTGGIGTFANVLLNPDTGMFYNNGQVVSYEAPGATLPGIVTADVVGALRGVIDDQYLRPQTGEITPSAYAAEAENPAATAAGSLDAHPADTRLWARGFGGLSLDAGSAKADTAFGGLSAGGSAAVDDRTQLGVLVAYARGQTAIAANDQTLGSDTAVLGGHGRSDLGVVRLDYSLLGGASGHKSSRSIIAGATEEDVTAEFMSWFVAPAVGLALPVLSADQGSITLAGSAGYTYGGAAGYTEQGPTFSATLPGTSISVFDARIEINGDMLIATSEAGAQTRLTGRLGVAGQYNDGQSQMGADIAVAGGAAGSIALAATPGTTRYGVYAGLGLNAELGQGRTVDASADYNHRDDGSSAVAVRGGVSGAF